LGAVFALIALILEIVHWTSTRDASLLFYALVLTTLAILVPFAWGYIPARR
jgi:hypothetical protein